MVTRTVLKGLSSFGSFVGAVVVIIVGGGWRHVAMCTVLEGLATCRSIVGACDGVGVGAVVVAVAEVEDGELWQRELSRRV